MHKITAGDMQSQEYRTTKKHTIYMYFILSHLVSTCGKESIRLPYHTVPIICRKKVFPVVFKKFV